MADPISWRLLVFGASGTIGRAVCSTAAERGYAPLGLSRTPQPASPPARWATWDPLSADLPSAVRTEGPFDGVCWAQGANFADSLRGFDAEAHLDLYSANCLFVLKSLSALLEAGALSAGGARLCVVSSIWEQRARQQKLSYTMTKAALGGLVRSANVDLAADGHLINGVLPGVLDTPMTAQNLTPEQLARVAQATRFGRLPDLGSVAELVCFLCSPQNRSISGQSIAVDLGFSNARAI